MGETNVEEETKKITRNFKYLFDVVVFVSSLLFLSIAFSFSCQFKWLCHDKNSFQGMFLRLKCNINPLSVPKLFGYFYALLLRMKND